jgi:hypothetical protein
VFYAAVDVHQSNLCYVIAFYSSALQRQWRLSGQMASYSLWSHCASMSSRVVLVHHSLHLAAISNGYSLIHSAFWSNVNQSECVISTKGSIAVDIPIACRLDDGGLEVLRPGSVKSVHFSISSDFRIPCYISRGPSFDSRCYKIIGT